MKTILRLGYAALLCSTIDGALAADTLVTSTVTRTCQINLGTSTTIDLTGAAVNQAVAGTFIYQCNFAGPPTTVNITSANGGLKNGSHTANYGVFLNDTSPAGVGAPLPTQWHPASGMLGGFPFFNIIVPSAPNTPQTPYFYVGLREPVTVAGTYLDTLTITISP